MGDPGKLEVLMHVGRSLQHALTAIDEHRIAGIADVHIQYALDIVQQEIAALRPADILAH